MDSVIETPISRALKQAASSVITKVGPSSVPPYISFAIENETGLKAGTHFAASTMDGTDATNTGANDALAACARCFSTFQEAYATSAQMACGSVSADMASVTKAMSTTTMLIRLVSESQINLDDPACKFLPSYSGLEKSRVTLRMLLRHRAGSYECQPFFCASTSREETLLLAQQAPLRYAPDTKESYSDIDFILLGAIIERVTGMRLDQAFSELVARPLHLRYTTYAHPSTRTECLPSAFDDSVEISRIDNTAEPVCPTVIDTPLTPPLYHHMVRGVVHDANTRFSLDGISGHAGLFSTLEDMIIWGMALSDYTEHANLWNPKVCESFFTTGPDNDQALGFWAMKLQVGNMEYPLMWHPGFTGTSVGFIPGQHTAFALITNRLMVSGPHCITNTMFKATLSSMGYEPVPQ